MARRRKQSGSNASGLLLLAVAVLIVAVAVLGPLVVVGWWLYSERAARASAHLRLEDLRPTPDEARRLEAYERRLATLASDHRHTELEGDDAGLSRRADGRFDGRSRRGRELNGALDQLEAEGAEVGAVRDALQAEIGGRIDAWATAQARVHGARWGLAALPLALGVGAALSPDWLTALGGAGPMLGMPDTPLVRVLIGSGVLASLTAAAVTPLAGARRRQALLAG